MKKILMTTFLCIWATLLVQAQEPVPTPVKSTITDVTVFLSGAEVGAEATVSLKQGDNIVVFEGLAKNIDPRSIQAAASDIVLINSVRHEINYLQQQVQSPRLASLEDSLKVLKIKSEDLNDEKTVLAYESALVLGNQALAGETKGVTAEELRKAADFFRSRLQEIQDRMTANARAQAKVTEDKSRIQLQMKELSFQSNQPSNDIVVKLQCDHARTVKVGIRYFVPDAGWEPGYDIRAKDTDSLITLQYRADIWQTTGVDWKQVKLTLSSGDPLQGGTKPELSQWNLSFAGPYDQGLLVTGLKSEAYGAVDSKSLVSTATTGKGALEATTLADYTSMRNTATTAEFVISVPQDIPSDGKRQQAAVQTATLPAVFEHYAIPKLDKDAFLVARIVDWEALNLLPGSANIYFDGTYVTSTQLDPYYANDTLDFSMGRDKKVIIERNMLKDFNARKSVGTQVERTFGYEFVVRNTRRSAIHLKLMDQIPVSQDQTIEVKDIDHSGASKDEATGFLTWTLDLAPALTQKFKLIYAVKHPRKSIVPGI